jgi:hypothetical protein
MAGVRDKGRGEYQAIESGGLFFLDFAFGEFFAFSGVFVLFHGFFGVGEELSLSSVDVHME